MSIVRTAQIVHRDKTTLTISSGVVTRTQDYHVIAAESGTSDELDTINLDGTTNYTVNSITYRPRVMLVADAGDTITLKHGTGNIDLPNDSDVTLTDDAYLILFYDGTNWLALAAVNVTGLANPVDLIQWNTAYSPGAHNTGNMYWDSTNKTIAIELEGSEVILQVGQEGNVYALNNSGGQIDNGEVVYVSGVSGSQVTVALAQADAAATATVLGVATEDIANSANGYITLWGVVRDFDTSAFNAGDLVYLSATTPGALTATKPDEPNLQRRIGEVLTKDASTGSIRVCIADEITLNDLSDNTQDILGLANGATLDTASVDVDSNGSTITCTVDNSASPGSDIVIKFSTGLYYWSMSDSVALTAGTDTVPVRNYVYLLESTKTLTASTSGWPATEHAPIVDVYCQSAASLQTDGAYKVHVWTDHTYRTSTGQGHLSHVNYWIRQQNATYQSGVVPSFSGSGTGTIGLGTTSGVVLQLHTHAFPAFSDPATVYVVNDSGTAFNEITNLGSGITTDSTGATLTNKYYALIFWGCVSEDSADCKIYCNVPGGSYNSYAAARTDADGYNNFSIPTEFKGTGFLIYRLVMRNNSGTSWTLDTGGAGDDLRGTIPGTTAGSSSTLATDFSDAQFTIFNNADNTKELEFDVSGVTTSTTRTLTAPDSDGTIALTSDLTAYALLAGRAGGQILRGGTAANDDLNLQSTSNATKGDYIFGDIVKRGRLYFPALDGVLSVLQDNYASTIDPTVDYDVDGGWIVGSIILNTTDDKAWICLDNTDGAAVWKEISHPMTTAGDVLYFNGTLLTRLAIGTADQVLTVNAGATAPEWADAGGGGLYESIAILRDEKAADTNGGGASATTWNARDLNTEVYDGDNIVSISSNQFTPVAGTYHIHVTATVFNVSSHRIRLYNVTGTATVDEGMNNTAASITQQNHLDTVFTANGTDAYRIDHYTQSAQASTGLGVKQNIGINEVYMTIVLEKFA
jgi:hypothetical protein